MQHLGFSSSDCSAIITEERRQHLADDTCYVKTIAIHRHLIVDATIFLIGFLMVRNQLA